MASPPEQRQNHSRDSFLVAVPGWFLGNRFCQRIKCLTHAIDELAVAKLTRNPTMAITQQKRCCRQ